MNKNIKIATKKKYNMLLFIKINIQQKDMNVFLIKCKQGQNRIQRLYRLECELIFTNEQKYWYETRKLKI